MVAIVVTIATTITACSRADETGEPPSSSPVATSSSGTDLQPGDTAGTEPDDQTLDVGVSPGTAPGAPPQSPPPSVVEGAPLEPARVNEILSEVAPPPTTVPATTSPTTTTTSPAAPSTRAPSATPPTTAAVTDIFVPPAADGPPRPGIVNEQSFPPPSDADAPTGPSDEPLEVTRFQPEGDVPLAPFVAITFSEAMVPLATLDSLDADEVPASIEPPVDGRWRWVGTRTLRFEPGGDLDRLPAATDYSVTVPADATAADGTQLGSEATWTFSTPPPSVVDVSGATADADLPTVSSNPVVVLTFDQRVVASDIMSTVVVTVDDDEFATRVATSGEIEADTAAKLAVDAAPADRVVAFTTVDQLPTDADLTITVGPDLPSAEGDRTNSEAFTFRAHTYGPLAVVDDRCFDELCAAGTGFSIEFNNQLDPEQAADIERYVTVDPEIAGASISADGTYLSIAGSTTARTTYRITLSDELRDTYGQTLVDETVLSFDVGDATARLVGPDREIVIVDPASEQPGIAVSTINHERLSVTVWGVSPNDFVDYREYLQRRWDDTAAEPPDWELLREDTIEVDGRQNEAATTFIDLSVEYERVGSQVVVQIEPMPGYSPSDQLYWLNAPVIAWVQDTTLAVDAFVDDDELLMWATDLITGAPVPNVAIELLGDGRIATTDDEGVASAELTDTPIRGLFANSGDAVAFVPSWYEPGWTLRSGDPEFRQFVIDDRGVYRPGETARIAGWLRSFERTTGDLAPAGLDSLDYRVYDNVGNEITTGMADINPLGGFNLRIDVPASAALGQAYVELTVGERFLGSADLLIEEFRTPEFEVDSTAVTDGPYLAGSTATVAVEANYFAGGPLADAPVDWVVATREASYAPPGWDRFDFGRQQPRFFDCFECPPTTDVEYREFSGRTDGTGADHLQLDFGDDVDLPSTITAEATVTDVNRQAWSSRTDLLVHPADYYVGLRSDTMFVGADEPITIDAIAVDIDGEAAVDQPIDIAVGRIVYTGAAGAGGGDGAEVVDVENCSLTSGAEPVTCSVIPTVGGQYRITATVTDETGRTSRTEVTRWVAGAPSSESPTVAAEPLTVVTDRDSYAPGDTARLLVVAPWPEAFGLVTITHGSIESTEVLEIVDGSAEVDVPITDDHVPQLGVHVEAVGAQPRNDGDGPPRPVFASGNAMLSIPPTSRTLTVTPTAAATELEPGASTSVTVEVTDDDGEAVADAGIALVVVDEAVLALTDYDLGDPLDAFYAPSYSYLDGQFARDTVQLLDLRSDDESTGDPSAPSTTVLGSVEDISLDDSGVGEESAAPAAESRAAPVSPPIDLRTDFASLALFEPNLTTGDDGTVTVDVELPDNLTRYRIMAVAVSGVDRFGAGESTLTARLPLQVQPSPPRLARLGDTFQLPVVVRNQTEQALDVEVAVEAMGIEFTDGAGRSITVPANDRVELLFPAAARSIGTATYTVAARSGAELRDAATGEFPVYTPATTEAFATYGVVDADSDTGGGAAIGQPLRPLNDVFSGLGGLDVSVSSTALQSLTDALIYLSDYPYPSADAAASRLITIATLGDILTEFDAEQLPRPAELRAQANDDIARLVELQNDDGGWAMWARGAPSEAWVSVEAAHALIVASGAGYEVPTAALDRALDHLAEVADGLDLGGADQTTLAASIVLVLRTAGRADAAVTAAAELYLRTDGDLEVDALAMLWPSIADTEVRADIERQIVNAAVDTAGGVTFATNYDDAGTPVVAVSDARTDAVVLMALLTEAPDSDLIPNAVSGLLAGRSNGRWNNVLDNAMVSVALYRYYEAFEADDPAFVGRVWLDDTVALDHLFTARESVSTLVPMATIVENVGDDTSIVVENVGDGRLYYRLGLQYAPTDLSLDPRDEGFVVERIYEPVDDPDHVQRDADGTWRIAPGATVRVRLTMVADSQRSYVALVDPMPAGFETISASLAVGPTLDPTELDDADDADDADWWWNPVWYDHQNQRDDRTEAFASYLPGGSYEFTYLARATTPGDFVAPPARAEQIYEPETFGRTGTDRVIIGG